MGLRTSDVVPLSEAQEKLTELALEVVDGGAELEGEHAGLVLLEEAENGLRQILSDQRISTADLMNTLSD